MKLRAAIVSAILSADKKMRRLRGWEEKGTARAVLLRDVLRAIQYVAVFLLSLFFSPQSVGGPSIVARIRSLSLSISRLRV